MKASALTQYPLSNTGRALYDAPGGIRLLLEADERALMQALFLHEGETAQQNNAGDYPLLQQAAEALDAYFAGAKNAFTALPLHIPENGFMPYIAALRRVPFGEVIDYTGLAVAAGRPRAARAAASACATNRFCVIVPCHRVVRKDGGLGGFAGGLHVKTFLLEHERTHV